MVAVAKEQLVDVDVDAEVGEPAVGNRALRQVVGDGVVSELFGRLDLDGHPAIAHRGSLADASASPHGANVTPESLMSTRVNRKSRLDG